MTLLHKAKSALKGEIRKLQMIPAAAVTLLKLTENESTTINELTHVIETEPVLAVQLLKLVNSAAFNRPVKITSIKRAVIVLGFTEVKQISLDLLLFGKLIQQNQNTKFDQLYFWQHCLFVAALSRSIAVSVKHTDPDAIYTAGLLHDIGKIVLETHGKVSYSDFLDFIEKSDQSISENETLFFGVTHAEIGHLLCKQWKIPASITAVVALHHDGFIDHPLAQGYELDIAIVSFANFIAWMQGIGSVPGHNHPVLHADVLMTLDIEQLNFEDILNHVDNEIRAVQQFYAIDFPQWSQLRATLIKSTIKLNSLGRQDTQEISCSVNKSPDFLSSLTAPHHNLNPDDFVPFTLEAIQNDFAFDRVKMLYINPKRRSLVATYCWPSTALHARSEPAEIRIHSASIDLLKCLRDKKPVLVIDTSLFNHEVLNQSNVREFMLIPVLNRNRILAVLYADNALSQRTLEKNLLEQMHPIANELGVALNNAKQLELEKKRSLTDPLTNINNRRSVSEFLESVYQNLDENSPIAVGFIDIDYFKKLNDQCGHQEGDNALKVIADILRSLTRPGDCVGRYGGEEFVFIHINTTEKGVKAYAERIRAEVERRGKILSQRIQSEPLTVSIGIAMHKPQYKNYYEIVDVADKAMYQAKSDGRNRVVFKE